MSNQISSKSVLKGLFATDEIMTASNFDDFISSAVTVGSGATIYNGTDFDELSSEDSESSESSNSEQEVEKFASIKVQLCTGTWWHVMHGRKTWTTTKFV
jgi:hypothetical protein